MKIYLLVILVLLAPLSFGQQSVPEIPFDSVPDFFKLPPGMNFGEVPGVAVNSKGHVFVFTRSNSANGPAYGPAAAQLFEFGPEGRVPARNRQGPLRLVGSPHRAHRQGRQHLGHRQGLRHDHQVQPGGPRRHDFRAPVGIGRRGSQAMGAPRPAAAPVDGLFRQPTDVAWDSEGNIYITDGYVNSRVAKYDKNGDWVKSWGDKGTGPGQFRIPHAIVIGPQQQPLCGRSHQPARSGVRYGRQVSAHVHD